MADDQDKPANDQDDKLKQLEAELIQKQDDAKKTSPEPPTSEPVTAEAAPAAPKQPARARTTTAKPEPAVVKAKPAKTGMLWFFTLVNLLLVIAVAGGGYWLWQQWQIQRTEQSQLVTEYQAKEAASDEQSQALHQELSDANLALSEELALLEQNQNLLRQQSDKTLQLLRDLAGRRPADWLLAEADYLIKMAGRKLWLEHDVRTAILMLQSADSRLEDLADPSLLPVRQLLAEDVQALQQVNPVSLASVALSISGLVQQVNNLPLDTVKLPEATASEEDLKLSDSVADWRTNLKKTWRAIVDDFITVTRRDASVQPYMSEQQQWLAKEQLKQSLLQAQAAVLREQTALYQQALQLALATLVEQFDMSTSQVSQFIGAVQNLVDTDIEKVYPTEFKVTQPMRDVLESRTQSIFGNGAKAL